MKLLRPSRHDLAFQLCFQKAFASLHSACPIKFRVIFFVLKELQLITLILRINLRSSSELSDESSCKYLVKE